MMLSRGDLSETLETANWYLKLRGRVEKPDELAGFLCCSTGACAGVRDRAGGG
jgi:hypothetical protein